MNDVPTRRRSCGTGSPGVAGYSAGSFPVNSYNIASYTQTVQRSQSRNHHGNLVDCSLATQSDYKSPLIMDCAVGTTDRLSSVSLFMGVESNSGAADARAVVTWPGAEVAARLNPLPDCSFVFQSYDSWIFELGDCCMAQSYPGWAILWVTAQSWRVNVALLHINLQSVFVPQNWPTLQTLSHCQLSKSCPLITDRRTSRHMYNINSCHQWR